MYFFTKGPSSNSEKCRQQNTNNDSESDYDEDDVNFIDDKGNCKITKKKIIVLIMFFF